MLRSWDWIPSAGVGIKDSPVHRGALEQRLFGSVGGELQRAPPLLFRRLGPPQLAQQLRARGVKEVIAVKVEPQGIDLSQSGLRAGHAMQRDGSVEAKDR